LTFLASISSIFQGNRNEVMLPKKQADEYNFKFRKFLVLTDFVVLP